MAQTPSFVYAKPTKGCEVLVNIEQVKEFCWDPENKTLQIRFPSGSMHELHGDEALGIWKNLFKRFGDWSNEIK